MTIDDSFKSFYDNGWPILKQKKIPFILFVNTREVNINHPNYMTWEQIRELKRSGLVTIGGHSFSHEYFVNMSIDEIDEDIKKSQIDYQREIGKYQIFFLIHLERQIPKSKFVKKKRLQNYVWST